MLTSTHFLLSVPNSDPQFSPLRNFNRSSTSCHSAMAAPIADNRKRSCVCYDLHKESVPFKLAWEWQRSVVESKKELVGKDEDFEDSLMVLQHSPVYTMGTGSKEEFLKFDFSDSPHEIYRTERGGEVTYHGPGQLVMYPILNLRYHKMDLHWYLRALEEVVIRVLSSTFSIRSSRLDGFTGVWVGDKKLAAIGVRVTKWISFHGLALNVTTDLTPFKQIVPCGIRNRQVGSIKKQLQDSSSLKYTDEQLLDITFKSLVKEFSQVFQLELKQKPFSVRDLQLAESFSKFN